MKIVIEIEVFRALVDGGWETKHEVKSIGEAFGQEWSFVDPQELAMTLTDTLKFLLSLAKKERQQ